MQHVDVGMCIYPYECMCLYISIHVYAYVSEYTYYTYIYIVCCSFVILFIYLHGHVLVYFSEIYLDPSFVQLSSSELLGLLRPTLEDLSNLLHVHGAEDASSTSGRSSDFGTSESEYSAHVDIPSTASVPLE